MSKKKGNKKKQQQQVHDDNMEELEFIEILIEEYEKVGDIQVSFGRIEDIENYGEQMKTLIEFSRYLTSNGHFLHAKQLCEFYEDTCEDPEALAECARVYFGHKLYGKCIEMNKKALLNEHQSPEKLQSDIGLALLKNGNIEEATVLLESTIKDYPGYINAYINLALCYKEQNDYTRALSSLESALNLSSTDPRVYSNIGGIYYLQEKYEDAIVNFLKAQEFDQNDAETLNNLGLALMKIGNLEYSNLTFEEALRIEPGNPHIISNYMLCLLNGKQFAKYIKMLSNVKRLISEKDYEKYKALHNKFIKACGVHQDEMRQRMKDNLTKNQSEMSWDDESGVTPLPLQKSAFSKVSKKKSLISIAEESENND